MSKELECEYFYEAVALIYLLVQKGLPIRQKNGITTNGYTVTLQYSLESLIWSCRTNIFTRSKGLAAYAAKTECTKITLGS